MTSDGRVPEAQIADSVMALPDQSARLRHLRVYRDRFDPALADAFREERAAATLRRDPREAGRAALLGIVVAEAIKDRPGRLRCLVERAKAAVVCGDSVLALDSIDDAYHLSRSIPGEPMLAEIDLLRAQPLTALERYDEARASAERALFRFDEWGDARGQVLAHMALADLDFRGDRPREALRHHAEVERLLPPGTAPTIRGALSLNRANALVACSRHRAAERHFARARDLYAAAGCDHSVAQVDYNAAYGDLLRGRYDEALRRLAQCEKTFQRVDDARHLAHVDLDRAEIHLHLNQPDEAAAFATSAEVKFLTLGLVKERAQAAYVYARAAELRGDANTAATWFERAERLFQELALAERVVACIVARAEILERQRDLDTARQLADSARRLLAPDMHPLSAARVALLDARLDAAAGAFAAAIAGVESVLATCRRIHAPWLRIEASRIVGRACAELRDLAPAISAYERAVDALDLSRCGVPDGPSMKSFLDGHAELYAEVTAVLAEAAAVAGAQDAADLAKSRAVADLVAGRRMRLGDPAAPAPTPARVRRLRERLEAVYPSHARLDADRDGRAPRSDRPRGRPGRLEPPASSQPHAWGH